LADIPHVLGGVCGFVWLFLLAASHPRFQAGGGANALVQRDRTRFPWLCTLGWHFLRFVSQRFVALGFFSLITRYTRSSLEDCRKALSCGQDASSVCQTAGGCVLFSLSSVRMWRNTFSSSPKVFILRCTSFSVSCGCLRFASSALGNALVIVSLTPHAFARPCQKHLWA